MSLRFLPAACGGLALGLAIGAAPAVAADAQQVADHITALAAASGGEVTYDGATADGDDVTITGYKMMLDDGDSLSIPSVVLTNVQPRQPGGFTADSVTFDNATYEGADNGMTWQTGSATNAVIPSPEEVKTKARLQPFGRVDITGLSVTGAELPAPLEIGSVGMAMEAESDGTPRDLVMDVASVKISPAFYDAEPRAKAVLQALGYADGLVVNITVAGGYDHTIDTATLRTLTIESADVGKLAITGKFSSVPLSSFTDEATAPDAAAKGKLDELTIRFDNGGVVERALDMQAEMMGATREEYAAQIGGALPFMLNVIGNQAFQNKVAAAGQAFLQDPKSITITAAPAEPVPFGTIMSVAGQQPQELPDLLSVDVIANH